MIKFIVNCTNSLLELWIWLLGTLAIAAALFSWFEGVTFWQAFYWACVTATSTGYGDIAPKTVPGQLLSIGLMFMALFFILPLMIARVINSLVENRDAWTDEEQTKLLEDIAFIRKNIEENNVSVETKSAITRPREPS